MDNPIVAAAVTAGGFGNGNFFHAPRPMVVDFNGFAEVGEVAAQRGTSAIVAHRARFFVGMAVHHHHHRRAVGKLHVHRLPVHHVVVALVDAAAVPPFLQCLHPPRFAEVGA